MNTAKRSMLEAYAREKETRWIAKHPEILAQYREQWIAIVGEEVVAAGKDLITVLKVAKRVADNPLVFLVPSALPQVL